MIAISKAEQEECVIISGNQIPVFRLICLRTALESEARFGIKMTKGRSILYHQGRVWAAWQQE